MPRGLRSGPWRAVATLAVAAGAALAATVAAPAAWDEGPGVIRISEDGETLMEQAIRLGDRTPFEVTDGGLQIVAPAGFPVDDSIAIELHASDGGLPDRLSVEIELPGGSNEVVPLLGRSGDLAEGQRRPPQSAGVVLALLAVVVVLWVTELVPLHVTSLLIPVVLAVTETTDATAALAPFFDPIIVLFFAGFLMALAMARVHLDEVIATRIVSRAGSSPVRLFAALLFIAAAASMWMSNTAAVALLLPIAMTITEPIGSVAYRRVLVIGIAYAATIGGVGSAIGTPANQLAIRFLDEFAGEEITFLEWFGFGLPIVVLMVPIIGGYLWWRMRPQVDLAAFVAARQRARTAVAATPRPSMPQLRVSLILAAVMAGWLTQSWHGVATGIVALAGAVAFMVTNDVRNEDLGRISWPTLLTFGGGLTLGLALLESGTSDFLVTRLAGVEALPGWLAVAAVAAAGLLMTTVASNTASAATLIPLAIPLAGLIGADVVVLAVVVAIASSLDFALVIGTPPTMLAHSTGLFTARQIFRLGSVLDVAALALLVTVVTGVWHAIGLV